jgi:hypothetical protein
MVRALVVAIVAVAAPFPHASSTPICGARSIPYQQTALASAGSELWLACRDGGRLERYDAHGRRTLVARLGGLHPWAVAAGGGFVWTVDRDRPEVWKLDGSTGRRVARIDLDSSPASLWYGAGAAWVGFDGPGFARIDVHSGRVTRAYAGDGASAFATDGRAVFVVSHRDNAVTRVDPAGRRGSTVSAHVADPLRSAADAAAYVNGSLWITGRGLDLLRLDVRTGKVVARTEIGPAAFALAASGPGLLVASYTPRGARRGDPVVGRLSLVDATGRVTSAVAATAPSYLSGLVVRGSDVYAADAVNGRLLVLRMPR